MPVYTESRSLIRKAERLAAIVGLACLLLLLALSLWNLAVTQWEHARNPVPGAFYSVEGRQTHLYCSAQALLPSLLRLVWETTGSAGKRCSRNFQKSRAFALTTARDWAGASHALVLETRR